MTYHVFFIYVPVCHNFAIPLFTDNNRCHMLHVFPLIILKTLQNLSIKSNVSFCRNSRNTPASNCYVTSLPQHYTHIENRLLFALPMYIPTFFAAFLVQLPIKKRQDCTPCWRHKILQLHYGCSTRKNFRLVRAHYQNFCVKKDKLLTKIERDISEK